MRIAGLGDAMFRRRPLTSNEKIAFGLFGGLSLVGLMGMLLGLLTPMGRAGQIEPQNAALCLGPFAGSLGAMALMALRRRAGKPRPAFVGAIVAWFVGISLLGWGVFNAFNPGDHTVAANYGYATALCFAPALIFSLLAILGYWHSELRETADATEDAEPVATRANAADRPAASDASYAEIERRAADYRRQISAAVRQRKGGPLKDALRPALGNIDAWEARIRQLTGWLSAFDRDAVTQRDLRETPAAIARLRAQLETERDADVQAQMGDTLASLEAQQTQLNELQSAARQTRLELEEALSEMGRIYSQLQLLAVKELDSARARGISEEIREQTRRLDDMLSAVSEVYAGEHQPQTSENATVADESPASRPRLDAAADG